MYIKQFEDKTKTLDDRRHAIIRNYDLGSLTPSTLIHALRQDCIELIAEDCLEVYRLEMLQTDTARDTIKERDRILYSDRRRVVDVLKFCTSYLNDHKLPLR